MRERKSQTFKTEIRKVDELKYYPGNPRKIDEDTLEKLKNSLKEFGIVEPLVINKDNEVIGGNQRLKVLREMGIKEVPVVVVDLPKGKEKALNLALNKIQGKWDEKLLKEFIVDLDVEDIELTGFDEDEITVLEDEDIEPQEDNYEEPEDKPQRVKYGDIWQLGEHRLMCGDSTKKEDVEKLMDGKKADMVFCDPPYGMNLDTDFSSMKGIGVGKKYNKVVGDKDIFNPKPFINLFSYVREQFWWGADYYAENIPNRNDGSLFVWDKTERGISPNSAYEKQFGSNFELCWSKQKHKRQIIPVLWKGIFGLSKEDTKSRVHPTQKPTRLITWFIEKFSKRDNIIVDLFGGSGSTLIAAEQTGRICYIMEIDPHYCDVIIDRWEKFTGQKAVLIERKEV